MPLLTGLEQTRGLKINPEDYNLAANAKQLKNITHNAATRPSFLKLGGTTLGEILQQNKGAEAMSALLAMIKWRNNLSR